MVCGLLKYAEKRYYMDKFNRCRNDAKSTWCCIDTIMNRSKAKPVVQQIERADGSVSSDSHVISNCFNDYFVSMGPSLDNAIPISRVSYGVDGGAK